MPKISTIQWLNLNEHRSYPLADSATRLADNGLELPNDLLVDLAIRYPSIYEAPYVGSVGMTPGMVSLTVCASDGTHPILLATLSVPRPVTALKNYALVPFATGVSGWVAFGNGAARADSAGSFNMGADAGALLPRCARPTVGGLSQVFRSNSAVQLTGVVQLTSFDPAVLQITAGVRDLSSLGLSATQECIVFRLNVEQSGYGILQDYLGVCQSDPRTLTCGRQPIFAISGATPDCNNQIQIKVLQEGVPEDDGSPDVLDISAEDSTLSFNYAVGLSAACFKQSTATSISQVQADSCDSLCDSPNA